MSYQIIQPPFTLAFTSMSKKEIKEYFKWFLDILPVRIAVLSRAVKDRHGFETWEPDFSMASLDLLGFWFAMEARTRKLTDQEQEEIAAAMPIPLVVPQDDLTNRTFSLAMDIGMYLSQVLLRNHPTLRWDQPLGSKTFVDYGCPVLVEFRPGDGPRTVPFNPVRMCVTLAYGLVSGKDDRRGLRGLREIYDIWSKAVV